MSQSIDLRRPRSLNDSQTAEGNRHPEVRLLLRMQKDLAKRICAQYGTISRMKGIETYKAY